MRKLWALLALLFIAAAGPAAAWTHGIASGGGGNSPVVLPGATQPAYDNTNSTSTLTLLTNVNYANIAPTYHGNPSDNGYNLRTWGQWNDIPLIFVSGTRHIGLLAAHEPTDVEKAAGLPSNVADIKVRCDEGSYFTITAPSFNPDSGMTDWNFTATDTNFANGLHKCDAIIEPATGPDGVMNGPPFDVHGSGYAYLKAPQIWIDNGVRGTAGHILTIPAGETTDGSNSAVLNFNASVVNLTGATIGYGWSVTAFSVAAGTFIDGDSTHNATNCVAETGSNCTGTGGAGTYHLTGPSQTVYGGVLTAKIDDGAGNSGNILTVSAVITPAGVGNGVPMLDGSGVTAGSVVDGSGQGGASCPGGCTGTGGTGTYHVKTAQLVASTTIYASAPATLGDLGSFYFVTNASGTSPIGRPTVYFCQGTCNGVTGNDTTGSGTAASPYATFAKAQSIAVTSDGSTTFQKGKWGTTICVMNPGSTVTYTGSFPQPAATLGYVDIVAADQAPCTATGSGGAIISQNPQSTTRGFLAKHVRWKNIAITTPPSNLSGGSAQYFVADHVTELTDPQGNSGLMGAGGWMCLESTVWFGSDGACSGARMVRGTTAKYAYQDCFHDVTIALGNTCEYTGAPGQWLTATYNSASPLSPTSVTLTPAELSGYTLSQILNIGGLTYTMIDNSGNNCFSGSGVATLSAVGTTTVTFNTATASGLCANGATVNLSAIGAHPDDIQDAGGSIFHNVFIMNNNFNLNFGGGDQALFLEMELQDGIYVAGNQYKVNPIIGHTGDAVNGGNNNVIYFGNTYVNTGSFTHDRQVGAMNETFVGDQCQSGGTLIPPVIAGVNIRGYAAASNPCYMTTTP